MSRARDRTSAWCSLLPCWRSISRARLRGSWAWTSPASCRGPAKGGSLLIIGVVGGFSVPGIIATGSTTTRGRGGRTKRPTTPGLWRCGEGASGGFRARASLLRRFPSTDHRPLLAVPLDLNTLAWIRLGVRLFNQHILRNRLALVFDGWRGVVLQ